MMKHQSKYSRRSLLKALGAGGALLPLLESDTADAACLVNGIKRLYILVWSNGMLNNVSPWPASGDAPDTWQLADFQASLQPFKNDLLLLNGIDYQFMVDGPVSERNGHAAFPGMLTGARYLMAGSSTAGDIAGGPSIDQYIGSTLRAGGYSGLTSLNQGAFVESTARLSWRGAGQPVIPDFDPYHVFATYFAGPAMSAGTNLVKRGVLDYVGKDLNRFMTVVGSADKQAIQRHLDFVRGIEQKLEPAPTAGSTCKTAAVTLPALAFKSTDNVGPIARMHMDLAVAAFGADLTRVAVMQIGDQAGAHLILGEAGFKSGGPNPGNANTGDVNGVQAISHRDGLEKLKCDTWFTSQVAYLLGQLKSVIEPSNKSLLDNSVVVAMNNMRAGTEEYTRVPAIMAGSCGGYFRTGRSLQLTGTPNNQVLVALCNAMGTPVQTFGEPTYGGELSALRA